MKVLVIGSGGREHALCWSLSHSERVSEIYCAPGNPGISNEAKCVNLDVMDFDGILAFCIIPVYLEPLLWLYDIFCEPYKAKAPFVPKYL